MRAPDATPQARLRASLTRYGAALRGVVRCRAGVVMERGARNGPGSAERHEECRTVSGTRKARFEQALLRVCSTNNRFMAAPSNHTYEIPITLSSPPPRNHMRNMAPHGHTRSGRLLLLIHRNSAVRNSATAATGNTAARSISCWTLSCWSWA